MFGIFSSAINAISNLWQNERNRMTQVNENVKDRRFQSSEAQKQRDFNSAEAALARQFAAEQADLAYNRNSYSSQVSQMKAAGINPALAYSSGSFQPMSPVSSSAASSGASPSGGHGFSPSPNVDLNIARQMAEIDNIKANTRKTDAEGDIAISDAKIRDEWNNGLIELQDSQIRVNNSTVHLNDEQAKQFAPLCEKLQAEASLFNEQASYYKTLEASVGQDVILKEIDSFYKSRHYEAIIDELQSRSRLSKAQAREVLLLMNLRAANLSADTLLKSKMAETELSKYGWYNAQTGLIDEQKANEVLKGVGIQITNERMEFDLSQAEKWDDVIKSAEVANATTSIFGTVADYVFDKVEERNDSFSDSFHDRGSDKYRNSSRKSSTRYRRVRLKF